jgi:NhaP-type Na+/H+ or K+/H+ antiporter
MTPRGIGIALLCVGAVNTLLGTMLALRSESNNIWAYVIVISGLVVMICGYFIGKRKSWN